MAPSIKAAGSEARRKSSSSKPSLIVTLKVPAARLRDLVTPESTKEETPVKDVKELNDSPSSSSNLAPPTNPNGENASDSNAPTPAPEGTPTPSVMGPPSDAPKKKGVKRSAAAANGNNDGIPKPRGKPGPKKKPRLEDGTIDHATGASRAAGGHKLGPKANQGAINAGLRALDRSGKPCRKWARGGFQLKSFTGVKWEVPRWTAPPKKTVDENGDESVAASAESSNKENKDEPPAVNNSASNSNAGADAEMQSVPSMGASSPAPVPVAAAS